jgi:Fe-S cluster biogenesis protein NfuA
MPELPATEPDDSLTEAVAERVGLINGLLAQHAGGVKLKAIDEKGRVSLQFTGMCTGCLYRPVTMAATIRPALMEIDGVTDVEANGSRIDEAARDRLEQDIGSWWLGMPSLNPSRR